MSADSAPDKSLLKLDSIISDISTDNDYRIIGNCIGQGRFSQIFPARSSAPLVPLYNPSIVPGRVNFSSFSSHRLALKILKLKRSDAADHKEMQKQVLEEEAEILYQNQIRNPYVPQLYCRCIKLNSLDSCLIGMELLLTDCSVLRKSLSTPQFNPRAAAELGLAMFQAIRKFHECGYVHRDLKPSNFAFSMPRYNNKTISGKDDKNASRAQYILCLIDFGQSKLHIKDGKVIHSPTSFRGTSAYASFNAHNKAKQGRVDDLWMLWFIIVDLYSQGTALPWKVKHGEAQEQSNLHRTEIIKLKQSYCGGQNSPSQLPRELLLMLNLLKNIGNSEICPDYKAIFSLLFEFAQRQNQQLPSLRNTVENFYFNIYLPNNCDNAIDSASHSNFVSPQHSPVQAYEALPSTPAPTASNAKLSPAPAVTQRCNQLTASNMCTLDSFYNELGASVNPALLELLSCSFASFGIMVHEESNNLIRALLSVQGILRDLVTQHSYTAGFYRMLFQPVLHKLEMWQDKTLSVLALVRAIFHQVYCWAFERIINAQAPQVSFNEFQSFLKFITNLPEEQFELTCKQLSDQYQAYLPNRGEAIQPQQKNTEENFYETNSNINETRKENESAQKHLPSKHNHASLVYFEPYLVGEVAAASVAEKKYYVSAGNYYATTKHKLTQANALTKQQYNYKRRSVIAAETEERKETATNTGIWADKSPRSSKKFKFVPTEYE
jgi:serine/threonine protein kinase